MLEYAQELLGKLVYKSSQLNWKVNSIQEDVHTLKCGFDSLEEDVTVLETACSELLAQSRDVETCLEKHSKKSRADLWQVQTCLDAAKSTAEAVEDFVHPCGGPGWRQVVNLDFSDINTPCPTGWQLNTDSGVRSCRRMTTTRESCDSATFPTDGSYSRVCGRISAFQIGLTDAFMEYHADNLQLHEAYLSGVSLTHGENEEPTRKHIWSFAAGRTEDQNFARRNRRCPCDNGRASPDFVGDDYFCESGVSEGDAVLGELYSDDPLWDGEGCIDSSTCCSLNNPPYFVKQLSDATSDDIEARLCFSNRANNEDVAVTLVELYVQ